MGQSIHGGGYSSIIGLLDSVPIRVRDFFPEGNSYRVTVTGELSRPAQRTLHCFPE